MGSVARKAGLEARLPGDWGLEGACPQCGFVAPREGVTGWDYGMLAGGMKVEGRRLPSVPLIMAGARISGKWEMPAARTLVLPYGGGAEREPAPAPGAPQEAAGGGQRAELVGTLARFIEYLESNGILTDAGTAKEHHMLHPCAYIAGGLGMRLGYDFDFLEIGAFSVELELDLFRLEGAEGGTEPFGGDARASAAFLDLVRGRDEKWLQAATFAMRERGRDGALEDFMAVPQGIIKYDAETVRGAFVEVARALEAAAQAKP